VFLLDADLLSQWRASYADDGRGFAIGFSPKLMQKVPAKQLRVLYEEGAQIFELMNNLRHVYQVEKSKNFRYDEEFQSHLYQLGLDLCAYKNPAFQEEKEIRLAHICGFNRGDKAVVALGARDALGERVSDQRAQESGRTYQIGGLSAGPRAAPAIIPTSRSFSSVTVTA
jgi:Protein of unknown function (DUF2971)